jgi:GNAT superfamily N-acetyltransferase
VRVEPDAFEVRHATERDLATILHLARRSLGWSGGSEDDEFFRWKHFENPFGSSPMWIALDHDRIIGFRAFLRWEFAAPGGSSVSAVRAVDTATDPEYQGRGVFTRLTLGALDDLRRDGVRMIFNTPNQKSLAGYLKMGWSEVGRLPVAAIPGRGASVLAIASARRAANRLSIESNVGASAAEIFADHAAIERLVSTQPCTEGLATVRSPGYLAWRYGYLPLHYRMMFHGPRLEDGVAVFRLRTRGRAVEAALCELLGNATPKVTRALLRAIAKQTRASYVVGLARSLGRPWPFVRLPHTGPVLASLRLDGQEVPPLGEWNLTLGDIELF